LSGIDPEMIWIKFLPHMSPAKTASTSKLEKL